MSQHDTLTLEPCPHCGKSHTPKIVLASEHWADEYDGDYPHSERYAVMCDASSPNGPGGCGASGGFHATEDEAVAAWNRRAALSATQPAQAAQDGPTCTEERPCVNCFAGTRPCLGPHKAAQSEPAEHWHRLYLEKCQQYNDRVAQLGGVIEGLEAEAAQGAGEVENVPLAWQTTRDGLLAYVLQDDLHNRLTPRVIDIAYTAFMYGARGRNAEDGSQRDWFNDTKPAIEKAIAKLRKDLFAASGRQS